MAIAKAFATGPKPKRSVVFVWHAGEEAACTARGSTPTTRWFRSTKSRPCSTWTWSAATTATIWKGTTRTPSSSLARTGQYHLHNVIVRPMPLQSRPLTLDYELNDLLDPESVYTRSDHYSYAVKGIPVAFFTTGLHPDYHKVSDTVDKILFPKMARIAQLVYETGFSIANPIARSNVTTRAREPAMARRLK